MSHASHSDEDILDLMRDTLALMDITTGDYDRQAAQAVIQATPCPACLAAMFTGLITRMRPWEHACDGPEAVRQDVQSQREALDAHPGLWVSVARRQQRRQWSPPWPGWGPP